MEITDTVLIQGNADRVFELASDVERWPEILPHYREVAILNSDGFGQMVKMHCIRSFGIFNWPCRWTARQVNLEIERRILFEHVGGPTKGMKVEWRIEQTAKGTTASIWHQLKSRVPILGWVYTDLIIGPIFIHAVAGRTLRTIKQIVEAEG